MIVEDYRIIIRQEVDEELTRNGQNITSHNRRVFLAAMLNNPALNDNPNLKAAVEAEFEANHG